MKSNKEIYNDLRDIYAKIVSDITLNTKIPLNDKYVFGEGVDKLAHYMFNLVAKEGDKCCEKH